MMFAPESTEFFLKHWPNNFKPVPADSSVNLSGQGKYRKITELLRYKDNLYSLIKVSLKFNF